MTNKCVCSGVILILRINSGTTDGSLCKVESVVEPGSGLPSCMPYLNPVALPTTFDDTPSSFEESCEFEEILMAAPIVSFPIGEGIVKPDATPR